MIDYPNELNVIFDKLQKCNVKPIIVGGYIRDALLNIPSKDIDIELYGISSLENIETILKEFGSVNSVGRSFGVCKLTFNNLDLDFSLPRLDNKTSQGHKGFKVVIDGNLDFATATSRRDFTMNAIGYDVKNKILLDPFNGIKDLKDKTIRAVSILKFAEDPLRGLRASQFSSRFNFKLDDALFMLCAKMINSGCLNELPKERIFLEMQKLFLKSPQPSIGLSLLKELGAFSYFKELEFIGNDDLTQIYSCVDFVSSLSVKNNLKIILMLCIMSHKLDKELRNRFLSKFTNDKKILNSVSTLIGAQDDFELFDFNDYDVYLLATKVNVEHFILFLKALDNSDSTAKHLNKLYTKAEKLNILNKKAKPILEGEDVISLGIKPSQEFSIILKKAYEAQMMGVFKTHNDAIKWLSHELLSY